MIEHFKPAGHKAQELSDVVLPDETFKPIQRIVDRTAKTDDHTIGYLFREVELEDSTRTDLVISSSYMLDDGERINKTLAGWKELEHDRVSNPWGWRLPSGPLVAELYYRSDVETGPLGKEVVNMLDSMSALILETRTTLEYNDDIVRVRHDGPTDPILVRYPFTPLSARRSNVGDDPVMTMFMRAIFGKRHATMIAALEKRYGDIEISTPHISQRNERARLELFLNGHYIVCADGSERQQFYAHCVATAQDIIDDPRYEVLP